MKEEGEGEGQWLKVGTENLAKRVPCCTGGRSPCPMVPHWVRIRQCLLVLQTGLAYVQTVTNTTQNSRLLTQCVSWKMQPRLLKIQPRTHLHNGYLQLSLDYMSWRRKGIQSLGQGAWCVCLGDKRQQEVKPAKAHVCRTVYSRWAEKWILILFWKESFGMLRRVGSCRWQLHHWNWHCQQLGTTWEIVTE